MANERKMALRRIAIKRQLRQWGVQIPSEIMFDIHALRALRNGQDIVRIIPLPLPGTHYFGKRW